MKTSSSTKKRPTGLFTALSGRLIRSEVFNEEEDDDDAPSQSFTESRDFSESHDLAYILLPRVNRNAETLDHLPPSERRISIDTQRQQTARRDHLRNLLRKKRVMRRYLKSTLKSMNAAAPEDGADRSGGIENIESVHKDAPASLSRVRSDATDWTKSSVNPEELFSEEELRTESEREKRIVEQQDNFVKRYHIDTVEFPIEVRINSFTYTVPVDPRSAKIPTVYNSSNIYRVRITNAIQDFVLWRSDDEAYFYFCYS